MKPAGLRLFTPSPDESSATSTALGSMRAILLAWGMATVYLYMASFLLPLSWTGWIRFAYLLSGVTWCLFAYSLSKHSLRLCVPVVMLLILQLWSLFTMVHGWVVIMRPPNLGRAELWMLEVLMPFFITSCLVYIEPKARDWVIRAVFIGFTISCLFAVLQFMRVPPFYQLAQQFYAQKDMDFWDGKPGLRAVGLTSHPALLAIQALVCFGIVGSRLVNRRWTNWEMVGLFFFSAVVVFSQARMLYIVLAVLWPIVGVLMLRRDPLGSLKIACIGTAMLIAGVMAAPTRLGYGMMATSFSEDDSYRYRSERRWIQSELIYDKYSVTGIGPSSILFLGEGVEDKETEGMALMESGYRVFLAMYGLPGLLALIVGLAATIVICIRVMTSRIESDERRSMGFVGLVLTLIIAFNSYSANTFDQYLTVPSAFLLCGALLRTRREEAAAKAGVRPRVFAVAGQAPVPMIHQEPAEPMAKLKALL